MICFLPLALGVQIQCLSARENATAGSLGQNPPKLQNEDSLKVVTTRMWSVTLTNLVIKSIRFQL